MRAVAQLEPKPVDAPDCLVDLDLPRPEATGRDLLVAVRAVSVNPVDVKVRGGVASEHPRVLGWDAAGVVVEAGPDCHLFRPGDEVAYAGAFLRPGTDAEFHLVDERLVGRKPATLSFEEAAALPLTTLTAWETLFDRLEVARAVPGAAPAVLVVGGAGGVASIAVQLLRALTDLTVIGTAARPETRDWVTAMGAHHVVDHSRPMAPQIAALGLGAPGHVFSTTHSGEHLPDIAELIAPQGRFALIDDPAHLDVARLKRKSVSLHWESMFTRSTFATPDVERQHAILTELAGLVEAGRIRTTLTEVMGPISAATLRAAHARLESGKMIGKLVVAGWA